MEVIVQGGNLTSVAAEALLLTFYEGEEMAGETARFLDQRYGGILSRVISGKDFEGRLHQVALVYNGAEAPVRRIVLAGLGKRADFSLDRLRGTVAKAAQQIRALNIKTLTSPMNFQEWSLDRFSYDELAEAVVEGTLLGLYQFTPYKTMDREKIKDLDQLILFEEQPEFLPALQQAARRAEAITRATCFARDLVSAPSNEMTPSILAEKAVEMASSRQKIEATVLDVTQIQELGMHALLSVARGSHEPARFILLNYRGSERGENPVALVGKGITFDSGGISLKPAEKMGEMKSDMAGAATVIATIMAAADLDLPVNLLGFVPATENLPGGRAYKPGDVLKSLSGQTIEVISTDAEGRLILADALTYAGHYNPGAIIDVATLTGACVVALGDIAIGMMGTDAVIKEELVRAGEKTGERVWELPLWEDYFDLIASDIADYKNTGGRNGGAITAAAFLRKFVGEYPWVHLDIAGPCWLDKGRPYVPKGASGIGVRLLVAWLRDRLTKG